MATTGKVPMLGFKAAAIKFAVLLGFTPNSVAAPTATPRLIDLNGSYVTYAELDGSYVSTADLDGSYVTTLDLEGSVS